MPIKQAEAVGDSRKLNFWQIAVSLVSIHYGLGFLIGSGEAIYDKGAIGLLYSCFKPDCASLLSQTIVSISK